MSARPVFRLALLALAIALLAGCAATPEPNRALERARDSVDSAAADREVNDLAGGELERARELLERAEAAYSDDAPAVTVNHRAYLAERQADIARETARLRMLERRIEQLGDTRERILLEARAARAEREAERARAQRQQAEEERMLAEQRAAELERQTREMAERAERLQAQIAELEARPTDRGLVLTLGSDVLFDFDRAELKPGAERTVQRIAEFLGEYGERQVLVEGFTDSVGERAYNMDLSLRRANAVRDALVERGVDPERIRVRGYGPDHPVADNDSEAGRQLNRRVEVIISDDEEVVPERD